MSRHPVFEAHGSAAASALLDTLLACSTQADAAPAIAKFLIDVQNLKGTKARARAAGGASVVLAEVLMLGADGIRSAGRAALQNDDRKTLAAKIAGCGDGIEAADALTDWLMTRLKCSKQYARGVAVDLLPTVRPDLFAGHAGVAK